MNSPFRQLLVITRKITLQLREIGRQLELKNKEDAKRHKDESDQRNQFSGSNVVPTRVIVDSLPPLSDKEISYQNEKRSRDRKKFSVEKWTLGVLALYAGLTGVQVWLTRKAIRNSEESFKKTLCQMQAQTANMKELADSAWLEAKGTRAALVVFSYRIDTEELTLSADNGGPSKAENVTAHIVLTRRTWPGKKLVGAPLSFTVPPQLVNQLGFIWGNRLEKKFSLEGISKKDWDATLQGEQFITVELSGSYDNGFREKIEPPKICESLIWLSPLKWKNNQSGGGPLPETCGRTFDTEMAVTMKQRKEMQEQIQKQGKK